jgi:murein DD-endopeptidase MepM/ murein hydrolase activator NlpD
VFRWSRTTPAAAGVVAVAAIVAVILALPAAASPGDDKARVDRELAAASEDLVAATAKAQRAAADYASAVGALPAAEAAVADAAGRLAAAEAAMRRAGRDAEAARAEQAGADQALAAATGQVLDARAGVARFASATYRGSGFAMLDSLLTAGSPTDFAVRAGYLDRVAQNKRAAVDAFTHARSAASEQRSIAAAANRRAQEAAAAAERALERSQAAALAARQAADKVRALVGQRESAMVTANEERGAVLAKHRELQEESARVAAELRAAAARKPAGTGDVVPPVTTGSFLTMPVSGHKTSNFGMRFHPLFHYWRLHSGMDIGAGMGSPIVAAADGEVVRAGYSGGSGNYTCVYHGRYRGEGIATCYAHQSQILVHPGQRVRRGQLIGRVGSTGNSTGPHLHFEVRLDGTPVDPAKWLPACLC